MVNKILNWSFGGFFRTLGKVLAYIAIGVLVGLIMAYNDIKLPSFFGIDYVYASEITSWTTAQTRITTNFNGTSTTTSWASGTTTYNLTNPINRIEYRFSYSGGLSNQNTYTFNIGYVPVPDAIYPVGITLNGGSATTLDYTCSSFTRDSVPTYKVSCTFTPNSSLSSSQYIYAVIDFYEGYLSSIRGSYTGFDERKGTNAVITEQTNNIINAGQENTQLIIDNMSNNCTNILPNTITWYGNTYTINGNTININNDNWAFYTEINVKANTTYYFSYKTSKSIWNIVQNSDGSVNLIDWSQTKNVTFNTGNNTTIRILFNVSTDTGPIDISEIMISEENKPFCVYGSKINKIDETTAAVNNLDDTLKDDDTDGDSNDMADFINDFTLDSDSKVSTLFMLPLNFLENILIQESYASLCTTFRGKNICLPSGSILWDKSTTCNESLTLCDSSSSVLSFKSIFTILVGGYLCYKMVRSMVHTINSSLDPNDDRIRTVDL